MVVVLFVTPIMFSAEKMPLMYFLTQSKQKTKTFQENFSPKNAPYRDRRHPQSEGNILKVISCVCFELQIYSHGYLSDSSVLARTAPHPPLVIAENELGCYFSTVFELLVPGVDDKLQRMW